MAPSLAAGDRVVYSQHFLDTVARPAGARVADLHGHLSRVEYGWLGTVEWSDGRRSTVNLGNLERHTPAPSSGAFITTPLACRPLQHADAGAIRWIDAEPGAGCAACGLLSALLASGAAFLFGYLLIS